jgi:hypothetical protein
MITWNWDPSRRTLRQFAFVGAVFLTGLAAATHLRGGGWATGVALVALVAGLCVAGWIRPEVLRLPYVLLTFAVFPIGIAMSHLILLGFFFGVITPLGVLARVARPDPLGRRRDCRAPSYWQRRRRPQDPSSYLRQA